MWGICSLILVFVSPFSFLTHVSMCVRQCHLFEYVMRWSQSELDMKIDFLLVPFALHICCKCVLYSKVPYTCMYILDSFRNCISQDIRILFFLYLNRIWCRYFSHIHENCISDIQSIKVKCFTFSFLRLLTLFTIFTSLLIN